MRYHALVQRVKAAVFQSVAQTSRDLRAAVAEQRMDQVPVDLRDYVSKVAGNAYTVTDDDVAALTRAGYSEDQIYEVTASAALGAALMRLDRGMQVLKDSAP